MNQRAQELHLEPTRDRLHYLPESVGFSATRHIDHDSKTRRRTHESP
jgi:hypothetical protein